MVRNPSLSAVTPQASNLINSIENAINNLFGVTPTAPTTTTQPTNPTLNYDWVSIGVVALAIGGIYYAVRRK